MPTFSAFNRPRNKSSKMFSTCTHLYLSKRLMSSSLAQVALMIGETELL